MKVCYGVKNKFCGIFQSAGRTSDPLRSYHLFILWNYSWKKIYFHLSPWVSWKLILGQLFYSHFLNKMMKHKIMQKQTKPRLHCPGLLTNGWVSKLWAAFLAGLTWAQHTLSSKLISSSSLTFAMKSDRILSFKPHAVHVKRSHSPTYWRECMYARKAIFCKRASPRKAIFWERGSPRKATFWERGSPRKAIFCKRGDPRTAIEQRQYNLWQWHNVIICYVMS